MTLQERLRTACLGWGIGDALIGQEAAEYIDALELAIKRIDAMNDHPGWFRTELNDIINEAFRRAR